MFAQALWMNIPLMVMVFALWVGIPLWLVLRRPDWQGKGETRDIPAYVTRRATPVRVSMVRLRQPAGYSGRRSMRALAEGANG